MKHSSLNLIICEPGHLARCQVIFLFFVFRHTGRQQRRAAACSTRLLFACVNLALPCPLLRLGAEQERRPRVCRHVGPPPGPQKVEAHAVHSGTDPALDTGSYIAGPVSSLSQALQCAHRTTEFCWWPILCRRARARPRCTRPRRWCTSTGRTRTAASRRLLTAAWRPRPLLACARGRPRLPGRAVARMGLHEGAHPRLCDPAS